MTHTDRSTSRRSGPRALLASTIVVGIALIALAAPLWPAAGAQPAQWCTLAGTADADVLRGTAADDRLCGLEGRDLLLGQAGDDTLHGGPDGDVLLGDAGDDTLFGGPGDDVLIDREGENVLDGGPGAQDRCIGRLTTTFRGCELVLPRPLPPVPRPPTPDRSAAPAPHEPGPPAPSAQARFVPAGSGVTLRGDALVVTFEEGGVPADAAVDVEVSASRTSTVTCVDREHGRLALRTSSTAQATETGTYRADAEGRVTGTRTLDVAPGRVEISGYDCRTSERIVVTLRDLTTGATLTLTP